jgi:hypothetical protein
MINKDIVVKFIPIEEQRYNTAGDYWEDEDNIHFRITKQENKQSEIAILLHEITEFFLTRERGLTEREITEYDLAWETLHNQGFTQADEPGNEPGCPYKDEHDISLIIERIFCMAAGINWQKHDEQLIFRQNGNKS